jgi:hypothetical protein
MRSVTIVRTASETRSAARKTDFGGGNSFGQTATEASEFSRFSGASAIERVTKTFLRARELDGIENLRWFK